MCVALERDSWQDYRGVADPNKVRRGALPPHRLRVGLRRRREGGANGNWQPCRNRDETCPFPGRSAECVRCNHRRKTGRFAGSSPVHERHGLSPHEQEVTGSSPVTTTDETSASGERRVRRLCVANASSSVDRAVRSRCGDAGWLDALGSARFLQPRSPRSRVGPSVRLRIGPSQEPDGCLRLILLAGPRRQFGPAGRRQGAQA